MNKKECNLEFIIALRSLQNSIDSQTFNSLLTQLDLDVEEYENRISGLKNEEEFILALYMLKAVKNLSLIDETYTSLFNTYSSDVIATLNNGKNIFIELKSTNKMQYKISMGNLDKKIEYAKQLGMPLYFSIKLGNRLWLMITAEYLKKNDGKVDYNDLSANQLHNLFGINCYFLNNYKLECIYDPSKKYSFSQYNSILDNKYGSLLSYKIYKGDKLLYDTNAHQIMDTILINYLISSSKVINVTKLDNGFTFINRYLDEMAISDIEIVLTPVKMRMFKDKRVTPKDYLEYLKSGEENIYNLDDIQRCIKELDPYILDLNTLQMFKFIK